eukprot:TRINITY_DN82576_c0_g2_i1.p1 TRINITY_DN82576_c0_g2~~TRINITY_DN82576_c0_g2_i1.p1  ORF type:complete len:182 (-),score=18.42 TRINITY_DN82576_c0_g2_i1:13-558(-)
MWRRSLARMAADVPNCMVAFGVRDKKMNFMSHPGVMAISRLLEMDGLVKHKADLKAEHVEMIAEFDEELAEKVQIAVDNGLKINFIDLEYLDKPEYLEACLTEKRVLAQAQKETFDMAKGTYEVPPSAISFKRATVPREMRDWPLMVEGMHMFEGRNGFEFLPEERERLQREGLMLSLIHI